MQERLAAEHSTVHLITQCKMKQIYDLDFAPAPKLAGLLLRKAHEQSADAIVIEPNPDTPEESNPSYFEVGLRTGEGDIETHLCPPFRMYQPLVNVFKTHQSLVVKTGDMTMTFSCESHATTFIVKDIKLQSEA